MKGGALNKALNGEIESFRESVHKHFARMPPIHLAYLHVRNIADRYLKIDVTNTRKVVDSALEMVSLLKHQKGIFYAPWIHHIIGLVALTLEKVVDLQLHPGATAALQDLRDALDTSLFRIHKEKTGWDVAISTSISSRLDSGGLDQLADAAVGETGATNGAGNGGASPPFEGPPDWTLMVSRGYLSAFE